MKNLFLPLHSMTYCVQSYDMIIQVEIKDIYRLISIYPAAKKLSFNSATAFSLSYNQLRTLE